MIFYWLSLLICFIGTSYLMWVLSGKRVGPLLRYRKVWLLENKRIFFIIVGFMFFLVTILYRHPLGQTIWCSYKGYEHSVETRKDWISGVCSYKGPNGAWIPIERLLGFPEGDKDKDMNQNVSNQENN